MSIGFPADAIALGAWSLPADSRPGSGRPRRRRRRLRLRLTADFFLLERKYTPPTSTRGAFLTALGVATAYATWVERCAALNGKFPYPFLTVASFEDRCKIYAGAGVFALLVFWGLNALHK